MHDMLLSRKSIKYRKTNNPNFSSVLSQSLEVSPPNGIVRSRSVAETVFQMRSAIKREESAFSLPIRSNGISQSERILQMSILRVTTPVQLREACATSEMKIRVRTTFRLSNPEPRSDSSLY